MKTRVGLWLLFNCVWPGVALGADYYVDNVDGDDARDGLSPLTAWQTLQKVNGADIQPGDQVLFKRGGSWRGTLSPKSGSATQRVVYGAYGTGARPKIMGSVERNGPGDWTHEGGNIWVASGFSPDVGNIIFDGEASIGFKVESQGELDTQGEYLAGGGQVKLYSNQNPADFYQDIELALNRTLINNNGRHDVTYQDLHLLYGAAHGVGGSNSHHVIIRSCYFSFIGGGLNYAGGPRFGNAIEFWENAHDNLVEGNLLWEIYDAALTNQGLNQNSQYNITYRNNIIWRAEYCFEYWNRPHSSQTYNIVFENNTCAYAGFSWGHAQRPDKNGWHMIFWGTEAQTWDVFIRNNIFYESTGCSLRPWDQDWSWLPADKLDYNLYYESQGPVACTAEGNFDMAQFAAYQSATGRDAHSWALDPQFLDPASFDLQLGAGSPAIDQGVASGLAEDFFGTSRPQGAGIDIGAHEWVAPPPTPDAGIGPDAGVPSDGGPNVEDGPSAGEDAQSPRDGAPQDGAAQDQYPAQDAVEPADGAGEVDGNGNPDGLAGPAGEGGMAPPGEFGLAGDGAWRRSSDPSGCSCVVGDGPDAGPAYVGLWGVGLLGVLVWRKRRR